MMFSALREATTTAESPEPLTILHSDSIMNKQNLQEELVGPATRHFSVYFVCSVDSKMLIFRVFRAFRGFSLMFRCGLTAPEVYCCGFGSAGLTPSFISFV